MDKNLRLFFGLLGSIGLVLLRTPLFHEATFRIFGGSIGRNLFTEVLYKICSSLSFIGVLLTIIFSITLIISNLKFEK